MIRILFLCHGNICRSPMAEFVMKKLVAEAGRDDIHVESAALHTDEIGNDIHYGTRDKLLQMGVPFSRKPFCRPSRAKGHCNVYIKMKMKVGHGQVL